MWCYSWKTHIRAICNASRYLKKVEGDETAVAVVGDNGVEISGNFAFYPCEKDKNQECIMGAGGNIR